jgi:hypothetical protein
MKHFSLSSSIAAIVLFAMPAIAAPVPFLPGTEVQDGGIYTDFEVGAADPDWTGTVLASGSASATKSRDGFGPGGGIIPDLYNVTATVDSQVIRATNGQLVFQYDFGASDSSFAGLNGVLGFSFSGFAGYDMTFAYRQAGATYAPTITRSADGDTITFGFFNPIDLTLGGFESFLFAVDAPAFLTTGAGDATILLDTFGTQAVALSGFLPAPAALAPVPLPASLPFLLLGVGMLGMTARRKRSG